jgi:hypothetical protein
MTTSRRYLTSGGEAGANDDLKTVFDISGEPVPLTHKPLSILTARRNVFVHTAIQVRRVLKNF